MIIIKQHRIYRQDLKNNPTVLYIFGDNLERKGMGGQAAEMRGEPNAFGIATKRSISHSYPDDYFFDTQDDVRDIIINEFTRLHKILELRNTYKAICIPSDGIGTGLSRLPETAPNLLEFINDKLYFLEYL